MKRAIAISAYDSFEEVKVLVDLIRHNWSEEYIITVYCNHKDGLSELNGIDVDELIVEENIEYAPGQPKEVLIYRGWRAIGQSCMAAAKLGASSVFHLFSDAWPLSEKEYLKLEAKLHDGNYDMLARGEGEGERGSMCPIMAISDMFLFLKGDFLRNNDDFFQLNPFDVPIDILNIHGVLSLQVFSRIGYRKFFYYDAYEHLEIIPGIKKDVRCPDPAYPVNYDTKSLFLHVHTGCFPGNWGERLQAYYLKRFNLTKGESINAFIEKHQPGDIIDELREFYKVCELKLAKRFIRPAELNQEPKKYLEELEKPYLNSLKRGIKHNINELFIRSINRVLPKVGIGQISITRTLRYKGPAKDHFQKLYGEIDFSKAKHPIWFLK